MGDGDTAIQRGDVCTGAVCNLSRMVCVCDSETLKFVSSITLRQPRWLAKLGVHARVTVTKYAIMSIHG